jgi:hypothetical protein
MMVACRFFRLPYPHPTTRVTLCDRRACSTEAEYEELKAKIAAAEAESRHLSARVPHPLYAQLEQLANARGETVSQVARTLIIDGLPGSHGTKRPSFGRHDGC